MMHALFLTFEKITGIGVLLVGGWTNLSEKY